MAIEVNAQGQVGPVSLQDGVNAPIRQGRTAEVVVPELNGRYYEQAVRGNMFMAHSFNQTDTPEIYTTSSSPLSARMITVRCAQGQASAT